MPYCMKCGARLPEQAEFCTKCGSEVSAESGARMHDVMVPRARRGEPDLPWEQVKAEMETEAA